MAVSDATKDFLEDVKKGKPRKFVLLAKGTNLVSLVLYKKGTTSKFVKEAKEAGTGVPYYGTVTGRGMDIRFQLATADGFDKPPLKDLILRSYLEDEADFKCKPTFEIVETAEAVLDPSDPLHARLLELKKAVGELEKTDPAQARNAAVRLAAIARLLEEDQRDPATAQMTEMEAMLKSVSGDAAGMTTAPVPSTDAGTPETTYRLLHAKLEPAVRKVEASGKPNAEAISKTFKYAEAQAAFGGFANANKALAGVAEALKKPAAQGESESSETEADETPPTPPPPTPQPTARRQTGPRGSGRAFYELWRDARRGWMEASEMVDAQLRQLEDRLKSRGDDDLKSIAGLGLTSITGNLKTPLMAALTEVDGATGVARQKAVEKAKKAVAALRQHIDSDERVLVCDENPFEVRVSIRETLGQALGKLDEALATGA